MMRLLALLGILLAATSAVLAVEPLQQQQVTQVATMRGLVAFWDFALMKDGVWTSYHDKDVINRSYPIFLRRIGDPKSYTPKDWPYTDKESKLVVDSSGPFGNAVRFNKGYIFAEVPRRDFDRTPLDIHGRQPFTLIAWVKFVGQRHLVAGIWDEGGWNKYEGRRQIALFGGLFGSQGVIAHVSATGAASFPQSNASGSQFARCRAIDGRDFADGEWVALAMTFDPGKDTVTAYLNGVATPKQLADPVAQSVFRYAQPVSANPFIFPWSIYSPRSFVLKFNGYDVLSSGVFEHWLHVDTEKGVITYDCSHEDSAMAKRDFRVTFDVKRDGRSRLAEPIVFVAKEKVTISLPETLRMQPGDEIVTSLHFGDNGNWRQVGTGIRYPIRDGAPFTFGRALGLGTEPLDHGTQLYIDGVAVFNRVLTEKELGALNFKSR
jgi:hypothetical protein